jgi:pyruvyl transferase EpsO
VASLRRQIDEVLRPLVPEGAACALLTFPNFANVGDSAIWLGQVRWLERRGCRIVYACEPETYSPARLRARLGEGIILLSGGGSLGDLWSRHQFFRETVIRAFPTNRIVQLPQTVCFRDPAHLERARAVFDAHPDLTVLVRNRQSLALARHAFRASSFLCPDMAFELGAVDRPRPPTADILWLSRTDLEARAAPPSAPGHGVLRTDWLEEPISPTRVCHWALARVPDLRRALQPLLSRTYPRLARARLDRGCRVLSQGRVVVTDRLHGHILSLLLGLPHVLADDAYGKVRTFFETWTSGSDLATWGGSADEALTRARSLLSC